MKTRLLWLVALVAALTMASCHRTSDNTENNTENTDTQVVEHLAATSQVAAIDIPGDEFSEGWTNGDWKYTEDEYTLRRTNLRSGKTEEVEWDAQYVNEAWLIGNYLLLDGYLGTEVRHSCVRLNLNTFELYDAPFYQPKVENDMISLDDKVVMTADQFAAMSDADFAKLCERSSAMAQ